MSENKNDGKEKDTISLPTREPDPHSSEKIPPEKIFEATLSSPSQMDERQATASSPHDELPSSPELSPESEQPSGKTEKPEGATTDIFEAIKQKDIDTVTALLEKKKSLLSALDAEERTPLQVAAGIGSLEIVKLLVECGANLESKGRDGRTALMHAISGGHIPVAEYLLSKGANANVASITNYTPLMQAAAKGAVNLVRIILPRVDNVNSRDSEGRTALMIAARFGHREIVDILLNRGASLLITDAKGNSAISYAETSELKQYLTQKAEEERIAVEKRAAQEKKEEAPVQEEIKEAVEEAKKRAPSLILIGVLFLVACGGLYFAYSQFKSVQPRDIAISPSHKESSNLIATAYCQRLASCRQDSSPQFVQRCIQQSAHRFAFFLAEQGGERCSESRIKTCAGCFEGLPCEQISNFRFDYLENRCGSCFKACLIEK